MSKPGRSSDTEDESSVDQLKHLRELVVGPTLDSIQELRTELEHRELDAEKLGSFLPEAIRRSSADGDRLAKAIGPTFSAAFNESVKSDPQALADAVSPIMGPAIQRYIQQQIQAMVQSLNTTLDQSFSPKGLRWRLEAWKTGKPFAEVVLLHTLIYRIEQVLLIDPDTGLLMQSASSLSQDDDADLVSSLLSAIQDFMRDSFSHRSESGSELQDMKTNELTVWIHHGPSAVLAIAIRGEPPLSLRQKLQTVLDKLHVDYRPLLENFRGDTSHLEIVQPELKELLESEFVSARPKSKKATPTGAEKPWWQDHLRWVMPTAIMMLLCGWWYYRQRANYYDYIAQQLDLPPTAKIFIEDDVLRVTGEARHEWVILAKNRIERFPEIKHLDLQSKDFTISDRPWVEFISFLRTEPGITVVDAKRNGQQYLIHGWRDPDSSDPNQIVAKFKGLDPKQVTQHWEFFWAADARLTLRRIENRLGLPPNVYTYLDPNTGVLKVSGTAAAEWIESLQQISVELGIQNSLDISGLSKQ